jgi:hypothetical protein
MLILIGLAGYLALGGVVLFLLKRLAKAKEELFAVRRQLVHAQTLKEESRKAAQAAEQRCIQALRDVEFSLTQAGHAMAVAGHIEVVSEQLHVLTEYIAGPLDAGQQPTGRHAALPGSAGQPAITSGAQGAKETQETYGMQEEYIP